MTSQAESQNLSSPALPSAAIPEPSLLVKAFASGLFTGYSPIASGTAGSALALLIYFIPGFEHPVIIVTVCFLTFLLGTKASAIMEVRYGHDPAQVTIDEILGMWISLLMHPKSLGMALAAFFLFRLLDIVKPFPARRFDRASGGLGIMLDDVVAAVYTNLILHFLMFNQPIREFLLSFRLPWAS